MKTEAIILNPNVVIDFTREEVGALTLMAEHHYDYECRALAKQGGAIYGLNNRLIAGSEVAQSGAMSFGDVDLLCKVCEQAGAHGGETERVGSLLYAQFKATLKFLTQAQDATKRIGEEVNGRLRADLAFAALRSKHA
jgi:hypothetical protein